MTRKSKPTKNYQFRAKLPLIFRGAAVLALIATVLVIGIGFYWGSFRSEFRMKGLPTQLSKDVVGIVKGYERRESENGVLKYFIKADKATTFSDEHQELENVFLQVFNDGNEEDFDKISADKAIYVPFENSKDFKIYFAGNVDIETRDALKVKTEQLTYDSESEIADAEELVEFSRENISGKSNGAIVNIRNKTLDLLKDVELFAYANGANDELTKADVKTAKINAQRAFVDQTEERIKLENDVEISLTPKSAANGNLTQPTDIKANQATVFLSEREVRKIDLKGNVDVYQKATSEKPAWTKTKAQRAVAIVDGELKSLELFDGVEIETTESGSGPAKIRARNAVYTKSTDTFELEDNVEINATQSGKPTKITAARAVYRQTAGEVDLYGGASVEQGDDLVKGEKIEATLYPDKSLKYAVAVGGAFLRQTTDQRTTEITADELNASFNDKQEILIANALGDGEAVVIPVKSDEYKRFTLSAPKAINLIFRGDGALENLNTQGRTTIKLNAPNTSNDSAHKTLTADSIKTVLRSNGNELAKATASGDAVLIVTPLRSSPKNYKSTIKASRFDCDFYTGNNAKSCRSSGRSSLVREPTSSGKSKQTLTANSLNAMFNRKSQDVERFEANGKAKFTEGDRNGISDKITYLASDGIVRLRGGEPTIWDSQARAKARSIDWDTRSDTSSFDGKVSTTYYSQKGTNGAAPFAKVNSPVFVTANKAKFDHDERTALYQGNARAWQDNNYVRAERIFLQEKEGQFFAEGKVQSLLYDVNRTVAGKRSKTPVYVSSDKMFYQRKVNLIRYEDNVDIRQGTDRMVAGVANIFLDKKNELSRTVIEKNVVITQPNRRASGDYAEYTASNEIVKLRGNPARVRDSERGSSQGREVTVFLKENRVVGKGSSKRSRSGRIRTVYKIKKGTLN